ncbi:MAG TPA: sigma factor, partial [Pyrinomonadaceae bacterium]
MTEAAIPLWQVGSPSEAGAATGHATDFELTQAASAGNMAAFEELYSRHSRRVYSLCLRMTANTAEAEDLAQEVFIQLYRKAGS